ncbi:DUF2959 domain-containing protein [Pseudomaricurvus alkylphenolicus]|uniref:DUF2959 domain-containing protein n=1 Tax=Pseudomaricurvus alkylphenolicus TaxID=1306991 RepID=UPI00141E97B8|nr:DUF2959 domain-containing protein [Pseudomaricurvus alkylphenolicus]NIB39562.1 DUF2959 domain-containing protein [Pseudomaricurvus alkylphenolicus]
MTKRILLGVSLLLTLAGCESAYYGAMEKVGFHKRDILVDRIEEVREAQVDAKEQFSSALERFTHELNFDGGELEKTYNLINDEYEDSLSRAEALSARIDGVENVAEALFDEWSDELEQYSNKSLRRQSESKLRDTRRRYQTMLTAMRAAEKKMAPVLDTLRDQTLYLKHNLNARAIASLKGEFSNLKREVAVLIKDMETSIAAADQFMAALRQES